jgi:hypothetical protein
LKPDGRHREEINRDDVLRVAVQKVFQPCDGGGLRLRNIYLLTLV